jgi:hypothetical protein
MRCGAIVSRGRVVYVVGGPCDQRRGKKVPYTGKQTVMDILANGQRAKFSKCVLCPWPRFVCGGGVRCVPATPPS